MSRVFLRYTSGMRGNGGGTKLRVMAVVTALAALLLVAQPAQAYVEVAYSPRGIWMYERPDTHPGEVRATLVLENLRAGESRLLRGESKVSQGTPDRNAVGQKITCGRRAGPPVQQTWGGTNLLARDGVTTIVVRQLFIAPAAGTWVCRLRIYTDSHSATIPARVRLERAFLGDVLGPGPAGERAVSSRTGGAVFFSSSDTTTRTVLKIANYRPPAGATRLTARADLFMTNCYGSGGAGCPVGTFPAAGSSTYSVQASLLPSNPACVGKSTPAVVRTFDQLTHHSGQTLDLFIPLPSDVDCGTWTSQVTTRRISGLPFVVQLYPYSNASLVSS